MARLTDEEKERKELARPVWVADFETVVYTEAECKQLGIPYPQENTEVWSCAIMRSVGPDRIENEPVYVFNNIFEFTQFCEFEVEDNAILYFHNMKFDMSYWLSHLINVECWTPCLELKEDDYCDDDEEVVPVYGSKFSQKFQPYTYSCSISGQNMWYRAYLHFEDKFIEVRDSAKLIPSTLKEIGEDFKTKFQKLEMKYSGLHKAFGPISGTEMSYIKNDVRVLSEAIYRTRFEMKLTKLTIGACALAEYKSIVTPQIFKYLFPDLREVEIDNEYGNVHNFVSKSYYGGWCYNNPKFQGKCFVTEKGLEKLPNLFSDSADVQVVDGIYCIDRNSMYPSVLRSTPKEKLDDWGEHWYPVGEPTYLKGKPTKAQIESYCVFRRFRCHFDLKPGRLPFVHIRCNSFYRASDCLESDKFLGKEVFPNGESTIHEFIMNEVDYELFKYCYDTHKEDGTPGEEHIDYILFERDNGANIGFDDYVDKWMANKIKGKDKKNPNPVLTVMSKRMLNSLYGKLGTSTRSDSRFITVPGDDEEDTGVLKFRTHYANDKNPVAMAAASYVTAYARRDMVMLAIDNIDTFCYSDTDSCHGILYDGKQVVCKDIDDKKLGYWDLELRPEDSYAAMFIRQKTYVEISDAIDSKTNKHYTKYNIKAAGAGDDCKGVIEAGLSLDRTEESTITKCGDDDYEVPKLYLDYLKPGFNLRNVNLKGKYILGGLLLVKTDFSIT